MGWGFSFWGLKISRHRKFQFGIFLEDWIFLFFGGRSDFDQLGLDFEKA